MGDQLIFNSDFKAPMVQVLFTFTDRNTKKKKNCMSTIAIDTTFHPSLSPIAARVAAGSLLNLVDEIVTGRVRNGFALIRPPGTGFHAWCISWFWFLKLKIFFFFLACYCHAPGHHSEDDDAMGFCFFNNVAVAAALALQKYPNTIGKILIIDWYAYLKL